jgi:CRISPR-associated protein Csx14
METPSTLLTLLGGQPQVVTFLLDLLLARGETIKRVIALYPASNLRYQAAFRKLAGEFVADQYQGRPCHLRSAPIRSGDVQLDDIRSAEEVEIARLEINQLLGALKSQGQRLHLGLSGGRRVVSLLLFSAATQYLTPVDALWHIYTPPELAEQARDGALMHASPGLVQLIPVPFVPWVAYFPGLAPLLDRSSQEMGEARLGWLDHTERARCAQVWNALTPRQRDVLRAFADGHPRQAVAAQLGIAVTTVDSHRDAIVQECGRAWGFQEEVQFTAQFLRERFGPFLAGLKQV